MYLSWLAKAWNYGLTKLKNEQSFNMAGVFTNLQSSGSKLKFWITWFLLSKNSPSDAHVGIKSTNIFDFLAFEENMIEEHKKLIEKKGLSKEYSK
jgi:hypothetical protein